MREENLATALCVSATARQAAQAGVPITVLRRGDASIGTMIVKINLLNGTARVFIETCFDDARLWLSATDRDPMPERDADDYLTRQGENDPDVWLIEIEDKQGRLWFSGKIMNLPANNQ